MFAYFTAKPPDNTRFDSEKFFLRPADGTKTKFPNLSDASQVKISVIVPAYNEEERRMWSFVFFIHNYKK